MSEWKKSVLPAMAVLGAIVAFVGGNEARIRQDLGSVKKTFRSADLASLEVPSDSPRQIPEGELFYGLTMLLERDYIEPITDERKLAIGAVKGLVSGLWDPLSLYLQPDHMAEHERQLHGDYSGLGVELRFSYNKEELGKVRKNPRGVDVLMLFPELEVATVLPGGPGEKVGLRVGDVVRAVNGKSLVSWRDIKEVRDAQAAVARGSMDAGVFSKIRAAFQKRAKTAVSVGRAADLLSLGEGRTVDVEWSRGGQVMKGAATTGVTKVAAVTRQGENTFGLRLFKGAASQFGSLPLEAGEVTIDLRQSTLGDPGEVKPLLERLGPAGKYGEIVKSKPSQSHTLVATSGTTSGRRYRLLVDKSTRGAAEILALALEGKGVATLVGGPMAGEPNWIETTKLEDGSGYTLNTGVFRPDSEEARQ